MRSLKSAARSSARKLKFGLIGAGGVAQSYIQALEDSAEAQLVAVADCRFDAAQRIAEHKHCRAYDGVQRMLKDDIVDAAIVCTPPATHADISVFLMQHGIHVLCEKPFSTDVAGAQRMLSAAQQAGVKLTMGSKFRYVEDLIHAKSIVASGVLGDLILFENSFASCVNMRARWNSKPEISGGGVLIDNGAHSVDLIHYFLGPLAEVHAREGKRVQGLPVEDTVFLTARSISGVLCNVLLSWSTLRQNDTFLELSGALGSISVGWKKSGRLDYAHRQWIPIGNGYNKIQAFRRQIGNFSLAIRSEEPLLITADDALQSVQVIESAYLSLRENRAMPVAIAPLVAPEQRQHSRTGRPPVAGSQTLH